MNVGRILAIAGNVFRETVREQVLYLTLLYALAFVAALTLVPQFTTEAAPKLVVDIGIAAIELVALIVAAFAGANLIAREIDKRTIFVLIAKPISRADFILGKHLGISATLAAIVGLMTLIYLGGLALWKITVPVGTLVVACFFIFWQLMLVAAIAILFGSFASSLVAALLSLAAYLAGNFSKDLLALGEITQNEGVQRVSRLIYLVLPDLSRANLKNEAVYGILPALPDLLGNAIYVLSYALLVLAIAMPIAARRQY